MNEGHVHVLSLGSFCNSIQGTAAYASPLTQSATSLSSGAIVLKRKTRNVAKLKA